MENEIERAFGSSYEKSLIRREKGIGDEAKK